MHRIQFQPLNGSTAKVCVEFTTASSYVYAVAIRLILTKKPIENTGRPGALIEENVFRQRIQHGDKVFRKNYERCFKVPTKCVTCRKLVLIAWDD